MNKQSGELAKALLTKTDDAKAKEFLQNFNLWFALLNPIIDNPENSQRPMVHSLILSLESVILVGLAERFEKGNSDKEKLSNFLSALSLEEKFFFCLVFEVKNINKEANALLKKSNETGERDLLDQILEISKDEDKVRENQIEQLLLAFKEDKKEVVDSIFNDRVNVLYGIRSKIVHTGSPEIGVMLWSDGSYASLYGEKDDKFFTIEYDLGEFFIRTLYRKFDFKPPSLKKEIENFLWKNHNAVHARTVGDIVYNKLKKVGETPD